MLSKRRIQRRSVLPSGTVDILLPPLRDRKDDIHLLFRKFAADFASKYKMPPLKLDEGAVQVLQKFR
jgi:DNA-binding NtrC family response regulator